MKFLFLVADGMGDWPLEQLGDRTPLEAAETPNMDALAAAGLIGTARTIPENMPPGSDVANMALLGFDPAKHHTGRGPIEAAAQGLELDPDDLVWRTNLVSVSQFGPGGMMHDYSAGHIDTAEAADLIEALQDIVPPGFELIPGVQYRHLLVQKGGALTEDASLHIRPPHDILDQELDEDLAAYITSPGLGMLVNAAAERLAEIRPGAKANAIWPWGQGRPLSLPPFAEKSGMKGAVISAVDLIKGLGRAAGMEVLDVPGATGLVDTDYEGKVRAALEFLARGDFVFVHLEGPDECAHGGDADCKITALERFDERVLAPLRKAVAGMDAAILVTCDHLTPISLRTHHADPVPFLLWWPGCPESSGATHFTEKAAAGTGLHLAPGHAMLAWALERVRADRP